jgi:3-hydroxy-D-aspartate aldolase
VNFNLKQFDSPSLVIFKDKVISNIYNMIQIAEANPLRLMPHVKTNKMEMIIRLMISKGITRFKAATIAEAELAAISGADIVLISHQLVGPKIDRYIKLIAKYPKTKFSSLVDCNEAVDELSKKTLESNSKVEVYYDINNGMDRTGHEINENLKSDLLYASQIPQIILKGIHVYDGHIRDDDFETRSSKIELGLEKLYLLLDSLNPKIGELEIIAGGTPAFTSHAKKSDRTLSPGTCVLWDWGYGDKFKEQNFEYAAMVLTRVISKPKKGIVTVDLGHKAVSAENPIDFRIRFVNKTGIKLLSQSEEHGVLEVEDWENFTIGEELLGIPYHICPTVNLYDEAYVVDSDNMVETWKIEGRKRKISI